MLHHFYPRLIDVTETGRKGLKTQKNAFSTDLQQRETTNQQHNSNYVEAKPKPQPIAETESKNSHVHVHLTLVECHSITVNSTFQLPSMIFKNRDSSYPIKGAPDDVPGVSY